MTEAALSLDEGQVIQQKGSWRQAVTINLLAYIAGYMPLSAIVPVVTEMENLSPLLRSIILGSATLVMALTQIPAGIAVDRYGGKKWAIWGHFLALLGQTGHLVLSLFVDVKMINGLSAAYFLFIAATCGSLLGSGNFQLISNSVYWAKEEKAAITMALHTGIGALVSTGYSLVAAFIYKKTKPSCLFILTVVMQLILLVVLRVFLQSTPYHKEIKELSNEGVTPKSRHARALGNRMSNRSVAPQLIHESLCQNLKHDLSLVRVWTCILQIYASYGSYFSLSVILPEIAINALGYNFLAAFWLTFVGSAVACFIRPFVGFLIKKYDKKSGGPYTYIFGVILSTLGLAGFVLPSDLRNMGRLYHYAALLLMEFGFGVAATATFAVAAKWSVPKNQKFLRYNVGSVFGLLATAGGTTGAVLPLAMSLWVLTAGSMGYIRFFYLPFVLNVLAGVATALVHCCLEPCKKRSVSSNSEESELTEWPVSVCRSP